MEHLAGPDVSVKETSVSVVDATAVVVLVLKVQSEPEASAEVWGAGIFGVKHVGLESGPL